MQDLEIVRPYPLAELSPADVERLSDEVWALAAERNAVILAHNYQLHEIQDVAHHMGDSLGSRARAAATDADVIAFCGVHFMAETASILLPEKTVLISDPDAGAVAVESMTPISSASGRRRRPGSGGVVIYVDTSAEGEGRDRLLLPPPAPSRSWQQSGASMGPTRRSASRSRHVRWARSWPASRAHRRPPSATRGSSVSDGECHVHTGIRPEDIDRTRAGIPGAGGS